MDNNTTEQARCQVEDGRTRGKVEGFCRLKPCFHQASARLDWKNEDYYTELRKVLSGHVVNAYEHILKKPFWSDETNRVDAIHDRFWQDLIKSLSDDQDDVWGIMLEHLKFEMIEQGQIPTEELERFKGFCSFLEVVGGATPIPTVAQKLALCFELFSKSWRQKFTMVPRDITNGTEDLNSVTKFMKLLYNVEQATQKRTSDGAPLKNSNQGPPSSNNKQKTRAPFGDPHKKTCVPRQHARTNHLMNGLIVTKIVILITINLILLNSVVMARDTKEVGDIREEGKEMDTDTTMDVVDVDMVVETTKVPLVTKVDPTTKAKIMVAKITIKIMATTANIITVVLLVTMAIISTRVPTKIRTRGRTKVPLTQV